MSNLLEAMHNLKGAGETLDVGTKEGHNQYIDKAKSFWTDEVWSKRITELEDLINTLTSLRKEVNSLEPNDRNNVDFKYLTQYLSKAQSSLNSAMRVINNNKNANWDNKKIK